MRSVRLVSANQRAVYLVLVKGSEQAPDQAGRQRRRHEGGDDAQVNPARAGAAHQAPELLLELHDLLLRQVGDPGQRLVEGRGVQVGDQGEVRVGGEHPARQTEVLVVLV